MASAGFRPQRKCGSRRVGVAGPRDEEAAPAAAPSLLLPLVSALHGGGGEQSQCGPSSPEADGNDGRRVGPLRQQAGKRADDEDHERREPSAAQSAQRRSQARIADPRTRMNTVPIKAKACGTPIGRPQRAEGAGRFPAGVPVVCGGSPTVLADRIIASCGHGRLRAGAALIPITPLWTSTALGSSRSTPGGGRAHRSASCVPQVDLILMPGPAEVQCPAPRRRKING